jgi:hypothetical protein
MSEDHGHRQNLADAQGSPEDYVAPTLTDLGSFQELTKLGGMDFIDAEGQS